MNPEHDQQPDTYLLTDPAFIIGPQRSGTTLLRLILDAHPDIAAGPETGFMRAVGVIKNIPDFHGGEGWYENFGFSEIDIDRHISRFYRSVFSEFAARQGKIRWIEKTPFHRFYVPELARMFPDARFIGMIRHPGAVAVSRKRWGYEMGPVLEDWVNSTRRMFTDYEALGAGRFYLMRYEDLVTNPRSNMADLLDFLEVPWSENVMRHDAEQAAKDAPEVTTGGTRSDEAIDSHRIDNWVSEVTSEEANLISAVDAELLQLCGYQPMTATTRGELRL